MTQVARFSSTLTASPIVGTVPPTQPGPVSASAQFDASHEPGQRKIPVLRPLLPPAAAILPYLERIDESRCYSNWGPLVTELGQRVAAKLGVDAQRLVCVNSGMSALIGAVLALAGRASASKPLAVVPEFTFTATGLAAQMCGYEPVIASCDAESWSFSPRDLLQRPELLRKVGFVMPVAPFGRALPLREWEAFQEATGIPVIVDGAACFDVLVRRPQLHASVLPFVLSFHATKAFGIGEGGAVVLKDAATADRVAQALNFGFLGNRLSEVSGTNGKLPEYCAAVGLAELDGWDAKHRALLDGFDAYRAGFEACGLVHRLHGPPEISCTYVLLRCDSAAQAGFVMDALAAAGVDSRRWYGTGLREHPAFATASFLDLHAARRLDVGSVLGLPVAPDLSREDIQRVTRAVARAFSDPCCPSPSPGTC